MKYTCTLPLEMAEGFQRISDFEAVESLLKYQFRDRKLLEAALTHPSYLDSTSYQRLEFIGDSALDLAISNYFCRQYPDAAPGKLTLLRSANVRNEKLARVAVRHQLYMYVRHKVNDLDERVTEFVLAVQEEDEPELYGGLVKAPKFLADIVESISAAVYVDCGYDLEAMWRIFRDILEPIFTLDMLEQKLHKKVEIDISSQLNGDETGSKQKLHELCDKKKWPKPAYKKEKEVGRAHEKKFMYSVEIKVAEDILFKMGIEKSRVREAENSAAYFMLLDLKDKNYL